MFCLIHLVIFGWSVKSFAANQCRNVFWDQAVAKHFVEVMDGEFTLGYDWKPRKNLKNKAVFLDGLSLSFPHSQAFAGEARSKGIPLVRLDMLGTGNSLKKQWEEKGEFGRGNEIPASLQVEAVISFIEAISTKPVNLVGLSYGGGIAAIVARLRPDLVQNLIMVNPFVVDLGDLRAGGLSGLSRWNPFVKSWMDSQRNSVLSSNFEKFLPDYLKDEEEVYFNALHALTEGIRPYDLRKILTEVDVPTHLLTGERDQFINNRFYDESFNAVPQEFQGSYTELTGGPHDIVNANPDFLANWLFESFFSN